MPFDRLRRAFDKPVLSRVEGPVLSQVEGLTTNGTNTLPFVLRLSEGLNQSFLYSTEFSKACFPMETSPAVRYRYQCEG
jgi:hypothetical protein